MTKPDRRRPPTTGPTRNNEPTHTPHTPARRALNALKENAPNISIITIAEKKAQHLMNTTTLYPYKPNNPNKEKKIVKKHQRELYMRRDG